VRSCSVSYIYISSNSDSDFSSVELGSVHALGCALGRVLVLELDEAVSLRLPIIVLDHAAVLNPAEVFERLFQQQTVYILRQVVAPDRKAWLLLAG